MKECNPYNQPASTLLPKKMITLPVPATVDDPVEVSIDRDSKSYCVFDNRCHWLMDFIPYQSEAQAEADARKWILENIGDVPVRLVYPQITSMRMSTRRVKKGKA